MSGDTVVLPMGVAFDALLDAREFRQLTEQTYTEQPVVCRRRTDEIDRRIRVLEQAVDYELGTWGSVFRHRALVPASYYTPSPSLSSDRA